MTNRHIALNDSFDDLFRHYAKGLMVYAMEYLGSHHEAEDVVHDVFVSFWERIGAVSNDNVKAYLFRATRNRCLDHLAHRKVQSDYSRRMMAEDWEFDFDGFVESELEQLIASAVAKLPPQRQKILTMSRFEGKSAGDIASELGISPRTVEKHIEMAVKNLRVELRNIVPAMLLYYIFF